MYKLIVIDLDGTMLNQYGKIADTTKDTIKKINEKGIEVIIASGRSLDSTKNFAKEIESKKYCISGNGAIIYDIANNEIIYENTLKKQKVLDIIKICDENSIYYSVYTENEIITKNLQYNTLFYYKENLNKDEFEKTHINIVDDVYNYIDERDEKIIKITVCDDTQTIFNSILRKVKEIEEIEVLDISHMSKKTIKSGIEEVDIEYFYTEISAKNVDKWNAIEILKEKMQISNQEIVAVGDNINDKNMIANAGLGIAMGQSTPIVKEIANYVTNSNIEDGVSNALNEFILDR